MPARRVASVSGAKITARGRVTVGERGELRRRAVAAHGDQTRALAVRHDQSVRPG